MSISADEVCACLVTRGDVDMKPILRSLPPEMQVVVWDNSERLHDWKVWGRYEAIHEATRPVIFFQDDDCLVDVERFLHAYEPGVVTGYVMDTDEGGPARREMYRDTTLLGWGAIFDRHLPFGAFDRYRLYYPTDWAFKTGLGAEIVFPMLNVTKSLYGDVTWLAEDGAEVFMRENRMWRQPMFYANLDFWLTRAREVRARR